ncbi:MAG: hypothetical protein JWP87_2598 [Labilithrix sp.]|nr:hypothetical protein [Labilithrix sp.]
MSTASHVPSAQHDAELPATAPPAAPPRPSETSSPPWPPASPSARWWFAFDRWFAVADQEEEFVLA